MKVSGAGSAAAPSRLIAPRRQTSPSSSKSAVDRLLDADAGLLILPDADQRADGEVVLADPLQAHCTDPDRGRAPRPTRAWRRRRRRPIASWKRASK